MSDCECSQWTLCLQASNRLDFAYVDLKIPWWVKCSYVSSFNRNSYTDVFPLFEAPPWSHGFPSCVWFLLQLQWLGESLTKTCEEQWMFSTLWNASEYRMNNLARLGFDHRHLLSSPSFELLKGNKYVQFCGVSSVQNFAWLGSWKRE